MVSLTEKEKLALYGMVRFPYMNDRELAEQLGLIYSTLASIKRKLFKQRMLKTVKVPILSDLGCEILVVTYTDFNPALTASQRIEKTGKIIDVFEEIFFSIGETHRGFSLSFSESYTNIEKINDIRTRTFAQMGVLDAEYPTEVFFPLAISNIPRFFDYSYLLKKLFGIDGKGDEGQIILRPRGKIELTENEKIVLYALVKYPEMNDRCLEKKIPLSRHTISKIRKFLECEGLIKTIRIPNIKELGFRILAVHHGILNPKTPYDADNDDFNVLMTDSTIFMATRQFEHVLLSVYKNFDEFNMEKSRINQFLKEKGYIAKMPVIRTHSLSETIVIKDFVFAPIVRKVLGVDADV